MPVCASKKGRKCDELWEKRKAQETEREELARRRGLDKTFRVGPFYREFWLEKFLWLTGLREVGERNARDIARRDVLFEFDTLPAGFDGYRILHMSDLHFMRDSDFAVAVCGVVKDIEADLCVLTGDYRHEHCGPHDHVFRDMEKVVSSIRARHGIAGILGNHDLSAFVAPLEAMGVRMLINESYRQSLNGDHIWIAGVDDSYRYECDNLPGALCNVPGDEFTILLAHSPDLALEAPGRGIDLYLCGHTHCGQIRLPLIGAPHLNSRVPRRFCQWEWRNGGTRGYTSAGVGTADVPVRFFCRPEVAVIELRRSAAAL